MDGPVVKIKPLNDADTATVWLTLRQTCENFPEIGDDSSLCQALLTNQYPHFSANAIKMVCAKFNITNHKIARAVIKQVCERKRMQPPRPPDPVAQSPRGKLSSEDTKRMLLALRNMAPAAAGDFSSFCKALLSSQDPTLLARTVEHICRQFKITDESTARSIIQQLCERHLTKPAAATSVAPRQRVTLSDSDAEKVWRALRNEAPPTVDDSALCEKLLNDCDSAFFAKVLQMVRHNFRINDSGVARAVIRQVCTRKLEAVKAAMPVKPDAFGLMPPVAELHAFRAEVKPCLYV